MLTVEPLAGVLDATTLLKNVDHAIATAFVTVKPARHGVGSTTPFLTILMVPSRSTIKSRPLPSPAFVT